ncbi:hypothetical protein GQ457_13G021440 [Hibiscus cannabinus]
MNVWYAKQGLVLSQRKHIIKVLEKIKLIGAPLTPTPMIITHVLMQPCTDKLLVYFNTFVLQDQVFTLL